MASRSEDKPQPAPPLPGASSSYSQWDSKLDDYSSRNVQLPPEASGSGSGSNGNEGIEMEKLQAEVRERERLLTSENKPNRLEGKDNSNSTGAAGIAGSAHHRKRSSLTGSREETEEAFLSSDDEAASAALLKGRRRDRTSWFTTPPVRGKKGEKYKRAKISRAAVCIGISGGITVLIALIVGGGVMVLGRKPAARSEGWYPSRQSTLQICPLKYFPS